MNLVGLLVGVLVICLLFWAVRALLAAFAVGDPLATIVQVVLVVIVVLWLLSMLGGGSLGSLHLGR